MFGGEASSVFVSSWCDRGGSQRTVIDFMLPSYIYPSFRGAIPNVLSCSNSPLSLPLPIRLHVLEFMSSLYIIRHLYDREAILREAV